MPAITAYLATFLLSFHWLSLLAVTRQLTTAEYPLLLADVSLG